MTKFWVLVFVAAQFVGKTWAIETTISSYPSSATSGSSSTAFEIGWTGLNKLYANDNLSATTQNRIQNPSEYTTLLTVQGFNFSSIPDNAVIKGVQVIIKRANENGNALIDRTVRLTSSPTTINYHMPSNWAQSFTTVSYGGDSDSWGSTLTPNIVKASNFGLIFQVGRNTITGNSNQYPLIDFIQINVSYVTPLPIELLSFEVIQSVEGTTLHWVTASEFNSNHFIVEKSSDGIFFEKIGEVQAAGNSAKKLDYYFVDRSIMTEELSYYRLVQIDQDGSFEIFDPITLKRIPSTELRLFPNPTVDFIQIYTGEKIIASYRILLTSGQIVQSKNASFISNSIRISCDQLSTGSHYIQVEFTDGTSETLSFSKV